MEEQEPEAHICIAFYELEPRQKLIMILAKWSLGVALGYSMEP